MCQNVFICFTNTHIYRVSHLLPANFHEETVLIYESRHLELELHKARTWKLQKFEFRQISPVERTLARRPIVPIFILFLSSS
jgi:hypothetical protein